MTILQLNPPLPVLTPDGPGYAHFLRDYGPEEDDFWTVVLSEGSKQGEFWSYRNVDIRLADNFTLGRMLQ